METNTIHANGLDFAIYAQGKGDKLALLLHGFPDTADTWHDLMPRLADAGYRVIAPYLRGYPPTQIPAGDIAYSARDLAADTVALIDAAGAERAVVIGHDWGAFVAYASAALAPERIAKLVTVAITHPRALKLTPAILWKARHFITFQQRKASANWLRRNDFAALDTIYRRWSPTWEYDAFELDAIRACLAQPGAVEAALGYYWAFAANRSNPDVQALLRRKTSVPTLCVLGGADGALPPADIERVRTAFTSDYQQVVIPGVGHFPHREAPDAFAEAVLAFLAVNT